MIFITYLKLKNILLYYNFKKKYLMEPKNPEPKTLPEILIEIFKNAFC